MTAKMRVLASALLVMAGMTLALPAVAASKTVDLTSDNKFAPASLTISEGDTVNFNWKGGFHDVSFSDGTKSGEPTANTGVLYSRTFSKAGTFSYVCSVHESVGMKGTITVQAAASETTTTTTAGSGGTTTTTTAGSGGTTTTTTAVGGGGTATTTTLAMPHTGPEDSALPLLGMALVGLGAAGAVVALRRMG